MHEINTELAIKYLLEELNLKNESELAEKLQISKNALSMLKKRNSLGTLIEKVLTHIDTKVSIDMLVYGYNSNSFKAQTLAIENQSENEFQKILEKFTNEELIIKKIKNKIQRIKGLNFLEKLKELINFDAGRFLILFYGILLDIEKNQLTLTSDNLNIKFSEIINNHNFSYFEALKFGVILKKKDFEELKDWVKNELDNVSIIEIISCLPDLKKLLKDEISLFNKPAITIVEKFLL